MSIFQVISIIFAFCMMYVVTIHRRKHLLSAIEVSLWLSMWGVFIVIALFPNLLLGMVDVLHFARVFDLLVVVAMMILTSIVVVTYFSQKELVNKLEKYVRKEALKNVKKK